jgi:hypothetical protein
LSSLELSPVHRQALDGYLCLIDTTNKLIGEAEVEIRRVVKESEDAQYLLTLPGVGFW